MRRKSFLSSFFSLLLLSILLVSSFVVQAQADSTWSIQTVDPEGGAGYLVLDSVDNPHIVYGGANGSLKYAVLKDSNWSIQIVDMEEGLEATQSLLESAPSLALDSNNHPHILYGYRQETETRR